MKVAGVPGFEPELQGFGDPPTTVILHPRTDWRNRTGLVLRPRRSALPLSEVGEWQPLPESNRACPDSNSGASPIGQGATKKWQGVRVSIPLLRFEGPRF